VTASGSTVHPIDSSINNTITKVVNGQLDTLVLDPREAIRGSGKVTTRVIPPGCKWIFRVFKPSTGQ